MLCPIVNDLILVNIAQNIEDFSNIGELSGYEKSNNSINVNSYSQN